MSYQPTLPYPYLESVDASKDNTFRCLINPRDRIDAYEFIIYDNEDNSVVYKCYVGTPEYCEQNSDKQGLTVDTNGYLPVYGWEDNAYLLIPVPPNITEKWRNGKEYIWTVKLYDTSSKVDAVSPPYYFKTLSDADINFDIPDVVNSSRLELKVLYSHQQLVRVSYYCFNLYLKGKVIHSTGNIPSSNIRFLYDGLISGNQYLLELLIVDDEKTQTVLEKEFAVDYENYPSVIDPKLSFDSDRGCIDIDYSKNVVIPGILDGNQEVIFTKFKEGNGNIPKGTNAVSLTKNQTLKWNSMTGDIPLNIEDTVAILNWHGAEGFCGDILEINDKETPLRQIKVWYDGTAFYYKIGTNDVVSTKDKDNGDCFEVAIVDGANQILSYELYGGGLVKSAVYPWTSDTDPTDSDVKDVYEKIDEGYYYQLIDDENILATSDEAIILCNDMIYKYWWTIVVYNDRVNFIKGKKYEDTVVTNNVF